MDKSKSAKLSGVVILLIALSALAGCSGNDGKTSSSQPGQVTITIGNHTDLTQAPSDAIADMTLPLLDMARYYNDENVIPGVRFEVVTYDGRYNPNLAVPGYEWLKDQGADLLFSPPPETSITLKPLLEEDRMVLFSTGNRNEVFDPPGWVFAVGATSVEDVVYSLLKWIPENDPGFPQARPARIGGACWDEAYGEVVLRSAKGYCEAHPEQYDWVYGELTDWKFSWGAEVEALKDCDYVIPNSVMTTFVREYRAAGGRARFIAPEGHLIFLGQIENADLWEDIDGMLFVRTTLWRTDEGEVVDFVKSLLHRYRPESAEEILRTSIGYGVGQHIYIMFKLIEETIDAVGPDSFDSQALYDHAQSFSMVLDGCPHSFTKTKRTSSDAVTMYEVRAEEMDLFRVSPWIPILYEP